MASTKFSQCRCCLIAIDNSVTSIEGIINLDMYINFKDNLNVFLSKDPRLPQIICPSCISFMTEIKSFRKMVMESEKYLFQIADCGPEFKVDVKQELPDMEDNNTYGSLNSYGNGAIKDDEDISNSLKKSKCKKARIGLAKIKKESCRRKKETDTNQNNDTYQDVTNFCGNGAMKDLSSLVAGDERLQDSNDFGDDGDDNEDFKLEDREDIPLISLKKLKYEKTIIITTNVKKKPPGRPKKEVENQGTVKYMHIKGVHLEEGIDYKNLGDRFDCCKCDKTLKSLFSLKHHIKTVHIKAPKHTCQICSKNFMTLAPYIRHKLEEHNIDERQKCNACDHAFNTRVQLRRHKNSFHMLGQKIKCESCDYESFSAEALYKHKFKHRTVKDYHCKYCRKSFVRKTTLQLHERIHTGDRRKVCEVCGQAFVQKASLNYHMTKYHPEVNF